MHPVKSGEQLQVVLPLHWMKQQQPLPLMCPTPEPALISMPVKHEKSTLTIHVQDGDAENNVQ